MTSIRKHLKLGELLIKEGLVSEEQLLKALEIQKRGSSDAVGHILFKLGALSEKDLVLTLSEQLNIPFVSNEKGLLKPADPDLAKLIPEEFARKHAVLPLSLHYNSLTVAMADPTDVMLLDNLSKITGHRINRVISVRTEIEAAIGKFYGEGGMLKSAIEASYTSRDENVTAKTAPAEEQLSLDDLVASAEKAPVVKLADLLIRQAIKERASDIHIEPFADQVHIRLRVDGVLHPVPPPDRSMALPLVSRIKILSKMDIAEKRLPQDGSFRATIENRVIDFRVSTIPTVHGEKVVMRILDRSAVSLDLSTLGFTKNELEKFRQVIHKPYGLVLITGPTGSGKTTTLYSALTELKGTDKNIITIEDPIEYQIQGINQVQVKPSIGLTFASGLRSFLRQDPDIMLVGETRDLETAQICIRAALTGHLVFSTLHTNDAPTAINRLIDIGIEPFFVSSSLLMVVAQRLVRRLCPKCKENASLPVAHLPQSLRTHKGPFFKAKGCAACSKTGYAGRMAIFEIMFINEELSDLISKRATAAEIRVAAQKAGMATLEESGYLRVAAGETSLDEVLRVTLGAG